MRESRSTCMCLVTYLIVGQRDIESRVHTVEVRNEAPRAFLLTCNAGSSLPQSRTRTSKPCGRSSSNLISSECQKIASLVSRLFLCTTSMLSQTAPFGGSSTLD